MGNVVNIGVYHIEGDTLERVEHCCRSVFFKKNIRYNISLVNEESLVKSNFDIVFVNISELIVSIKKKTQPIINRIKSLVIALANDIDSLLYAFKLNAYRAFTDMTNDCEICEIIYGVLENIEDIDKICITEGDDTLLIDVDNVLYLEALGDNSIIVMPERQIVSCKNLKYWENKLDAKHFVRCHKSFLVSIDKIENIKESRIIFKDKKNKYEVPVSVRKMSLIQRLLDLK